MRNSLAFICGTLMISLAVAKEVKRGDVPTTDDPAYIEKLHAQKMTPQNGSDKRRHAGDKKVIGTEKEMEEHMPHDHLPAANPVKRK